MRDILAAKWLLLDLSSALMLSARPRISVALLALHSPSPGHLFSVFISHLTFPTAVHASCRTPASRKVSL